MPKSTATAEETSPESEAEPTLHGMYLYQLHLRNFRSCRETTVKLQPALTIIVGENNSGKSNVIDATRLITSPLSGRRSRYFDNDDLSYKADTNVIELMAEYRDLTQVQRAHFLAATQLSTGTAWYTARYTADDKLLPRLRTTYLANNPISSDPEPEKREKINHVYLAPLRDAQRELDSAAGNRLSQIIRYLTDEPERDDFLTQANNSLRELEKHSVLDGTTKALQTHLGRLTTPVRGQNVGLGFEDFRLHRLTRSLRLKMAEHGVDLSDIADSGLGYANLLYMASVILELQNAQDSELTVFLVEEPEAHLHPQLQAILLDYLSEQANQSLHPDRDRPAGRIQVIATTHSPNLASSVGIENVVVLRTVEKIVTFDEEKTTTERNSTAVSLTDAVISDDERRKINQYLDVTRAELLFTRRAILVEGIAEAVLLPALARRVLTDPKDLQAFQAISIIAVGSVDFAPYVKLLAAPIGNLQLLDRLVVITDGDPDLTGSEPPIADQDEDNEPAINNRRTRLENILDEEAQRVLVVAESTFTLEADLLIPVDPNSGPLRVAFLKQKPRSEARWQEFLDAAEPARAFYERLRKTKKYLGKGEFAHDLAAALEKGAPFECPPYLADAIRKSLE